MSEEYPANDVGTPPISRADPPATPAGTRAAAAREPASCKEDAENAGHDPDPASSRSDRVFPTSGLTERRTVRRAPTDRALGPTSTSEAAASKFRAIRSKRLGRKTLAQAIRDLVTPQEQAMWLLRFSQGLDPDLQDSAGFARPTLGERLKARIAMLEFAYGTAPQRVQIEAELRATTGALDGDFSRFSDAELAQYRQLARKALAAGVRKTIDAEATERRDDERSHDED